ncbi:conserved hypothetical protein, partial [Ricinus communis]
HDDQREQRQRQPDHQRGRQVRDQLRPPGRVVHAQLQAQAGQVEQALGQVEAAAPRQAGARQPRAVALDERHLEAARLVLGDGLLQQRPQAHGGDDVGGGFAGAHARQAQVGDLQSVAARARHEVRAGEQRRALTQRGDAGELGLQLQLVA